MNISTYDGLREHLLKMGITPPESSHPDVLMMLSANSKTGKGEEVTKPTSGRDLEKDSQSDSENLASDKPEQTTKPTSGRVTKKSTPSVEKSKVATKSASSKPKQTRRRRTTRKTSSSSKKAPAKK